MKGYLFHKGNLKLVVSKAYMLGVNGEPQPVNHSHFVEILCVEPAGQVRK
jgi:hypothetical protein